MNPRKRFVLGLALVDLGILVLGWFTWCAGKNFSYSWSSPGEKFLKDIFARVDYGGLFLTLVVALLISAGVFFCVDALVWRRHAGSPPPPSP